MRDHAPSPERGSDAAPLALLNGDPGPGTAKARALLTRAGLRVADLGGAGAAGATLAVLVGQAPVAGRLERIAAAVAAHPRLPLLATMPAESTSAQLRRAMQAGAAGLVLDDRVETSLAASALAVAAGQLALPPTLGRRIAPRPLSYREKQILGLVVRGLTNRQIADRLYVAESTVKTHLSSSMRKLDVRSRAEAAAVVLDPEEPLGAAVLATIPALDQTDDQAGDGARKIGAPPVVELA